MSESEGRRKPLLCHLGLHQLSQDAAWFTTATVCNRCGGYTDPEKGKRLTLERKLWSEAGDLHLSHEQQLAYVRAHLQGSNLDLVPPRPST